MGRSDNIAAYEAVVQGSRYPKNFFSYAERNQRITEILAFVFEKAGICNYKEAYSVLDEKFIIENHLEEIAKVADRPPEIYPDEYFHLAWYVFPDERPTEEQRIYTMIDNVVSGKRNKFPAKVFTSGKRTAERGIIAFRYLCENVLKLDRKQIIETFGRSSGIKILGEYKMRVLTSVVFPSLQHLLLAAYPDIFKEEHE